MRKKNMFVSAEVKELMQMEFIIPLQRLFKGLDVWIAEQNTEWLEAAIQDQPLANSSDKPSQTYH